MQTFNGRDQVTKTRQYAGDTNSTSFQDVTMTYDGHGRAKTQHYPVEDANTDTTWIYNADDSVQQTIDPRGAIQNFTYNSRGLVEQISYQVPSGSGIALTPTATFSYDAAGNRYLTADGSGTLTYSLDSLSRITSETKVFSGIPDNFTLNYEYQLNGDVKTLGIVPNNTSVSYAYDPTGRVTSVSGQGFSDTETNTNVSTIVSSLGYRAWNGVKSAAYGDTKTASLTYDNSLKVSSFRLPGLIETDYDQNNDGRTKFVNNLIDGRFDRSFTYDFRENLKSAKTGEEANGGSQMTGPYNTTVNFDAFGNLTNRSTVHWDTNHPYSFQPAYNNGRQIGAQHDAAGNVTGDGLFYEFDAAGNNVKVAPSVEQESGTCYETHRKQDLSYDADGQRSALYDETKRYCVYIGGQTILLSVSASTDYNVKSSVLGGKVVYVHRAISQWTNTGQNSTGTIRNTKIYLGDKVLAVSQSTTAQQYNSFRWSHTDPSATTIVETKPNGQGTRFELDPFGADVGLESPYGGGNPDPPVSVGYGEMGGPEAIEWVEVDGVWAPANLFPGMMANASRCPRRGCGPIHTENGFEYWSAFADGYEGYLPLGATYAGYGHWSWNSWAGPAQPNRSQTTQSASVRKAPTIKHRKIGKQEAKAGRRLAQSGIWDDETLYEPLPSRIDLREMIVRRLDEDGGRCRKFLDSVRANLGIKQTVEDVYDGIFAVGIIALGPDLPASVGGRTPYNSNKYGNFPIGVRPESGKSSEYERWTTRERYLRVVLHEILHRAGVGDHRAFAQAGFKSLDLQQKADNRVPTTPDKGYDMDETYSFYFSKLIGLLCGKEWTNGPK